VDLLQHLEDVKGPRADSLSPALLGALDTGCLGSLWGLSLPSGFARLGGHREYFDLDYNTRKVTANRQHSFKAEKHTQFQNNSPARIKSIIHGSCGYIEADKTNHCKHFKHFKLLVKICNQVSFCSFKKHLFTFLRLKPPHRDM